MEASKSSTPPRRPPRTQTATLTPPARNPLQVTRLRYSVPRAIAAYAAAAAAIEVAAAPGSQAEAAQQ